MTLFPFQNLPEGSESLAGNRVLPHSPGCSSDGTRCSAPRGLAQDSLRSWTWVLLGADTLTHAEHLRHSSFPREMSLGHTVHRTAKTFPLVNTSDSNAS